MLQKVAARCILNLRFNDFGKVRTFARNLCSVDGENVSRFSTVAATNPRRAAAEMKVHIVPALSDNFMYLLVDEKSGVCAAVDPVEPDKVVARVRALGARLVAILTTHHHWDHAGESCEFIMGIIR